MAGLAWLTYRHRPSEPRLVCDLSLADRQPIRQPIRQIKPVRSVAQDGYGGCDPEL